MENKLKETLPEWVRKIDGIEYIWSIGVQGEYIVIGSDIGIHVFSTKGDKLWEYKTNKFTFCCIIDKHIMAGSMDCHVYCFDIEGNMKWKYKVDEEIRSIDAWNKRVAVCDLRSIYLFDINGCLMWKRNTNEFHKEKVAFLSVNINDGYITAGSCTEWNGFLYLFDLNGNLKWKYDVMPENGGEGHVTSVCISNGYICAGSSNHYVYLFDTNGNLKWKYETVSEVEFVQIYKGYIGTSDGWGTCLLDIYGNLKWVYNVPISSGYHHICSEYVAICSSSGDRVGEICLFDVDGNLKIKYKAMREKPGKQWTINMDEEGKTEIIQRFECPIPFVHMSDRYLVAGGRGYIYLFNLKEVDNMYDLGRLVVKHTEYGPKGHLEIYPYY